MWPVVWKSCDHWVLVRQPSLKWLAPRLIYSLAQWPRDRLGGLCAGCVLCSFACSVRRFPSRRRWTGPLTPACLTRRSQPSPVRTCAGIILTSEGKETTGVSLGCGALWELGSWGLFLTPHHQATVGPIPLQSLLLFINPNPRLLPQGPAIHACSLSSRGRALVGNLTPPLPPQFIYMLASGMVPGT